MIKGNITSYTVKRKSRHVKVNSGLGGNGVAGAGLGEQRTWEDTYNRRPEAVALSPLLEEEQRKRWNLMVEQQNKYLGGSPQWALGGVASPAALLALYPALENVDWSSRPLVEDLKEETSTRLCSVIKPSFEHPHQRQQFAQSLPFDLNSNGPYADGSMDLHSSFLLTDDVSDFFKPEMRHTSFLDSSPEPSSCNSSEVTCMGPSSQTSFPDSSPEPLSSNSSEITCMSISSEREHLVTFGSPYISAIHSPLHQESRVDSNEGFRLNDYFGTGRESELELGKAIFSNDEMQTLVTSPKPCTENGLPLADGNTNVCFEESQGHDKALKEAAAKLNTDCHGSILSSEAPRTIAAQPGCATEPHSTPSQGLKKVHNESGTVLPDIDSPQDPLYAERHPETEHEDSSFPLVGSETEITSVQGAGDGNEDIGKLSERGPSPLSADETSPESESDGGYESTTERSILSCSQKDLISRLMDEICSSFFFQLTHGLHQRGPKSGESFSSDDTQTSISTKNSSENGSSANRGKRARDDEDPSDERRHKRRRRPSKGSFSSDLPLAEIRYFACPFHKFDMSTYSDRNSSPDLALKYRSCGPPGRPTIGRMKEHLYRTHQTPIHCPRCWTIMKTEAELGEHARADLQCRILPQPLRWIPREVVTKLKDRKKAFSGQTDEDTWRYIYGLLFPDSVHIPSPYYDEDVALEGRDVNASPTWQAIAAYEEYARAHLPRLVEEALETAVAEQTQPIEESLRRALAGIVRDCQARLALDFLHRRSANQGDNGLLPLEALPSFYIEPLNLADETLLFDTEYIMPNDPHSSRPHTDSGYESINQAFYRSSGDALELQSLRNGTGSSDDPFSDCNDVLGENLGTANTLEDGGWVAMSFNDDH